MWPFEKQDINKGVLECKSISGAVLLDVREENEFREGHIPGAVNLPLSKITSISYAKETPLFLYCLRGSRSSKAAWILKELGFSNIKSIGGITKYKGGLEV